MSLTRDQIAAEALALVDAEGLDRLSMRALGKRLGVEAMALYHHFPSKGTLLDAIAEQVLIGLRVPATGAPLARIRAGLRAYRGLARAHPHAFVLLTTRRFATPRALAKLEELLAPFADAGFDPAMTARWFRVGGYFAGGAGHAEIASRSLQPDPTPPAMEQAGGLAGFPHAARVAPFLRAAALDDLFEFGLDQLLAAMAASPRRRRARKPR